MSNPPDITKYFWFAISLNARVTKQVGMLLMIMGVHQQVAPLYTSLL